MKYQNYNDIDLHEELMMEMTAYGSDEHEIYEKINFIEYLLVSNVELFNEWFHRIINHYEIKTYIRDDILMQYLYHDWNAATEEWFKYGGVVGEMIQLYIDELTDKLQDEWERCQSW